MENCLPDFILDLSPFTFTLVLVVSSNAEWTGLGMPFLTGCLRDQIKA